MYKMHLCLCGLFPIFLMDTFCLHDCSFNFLLSIFIKFWVGLFLRLSSSFGWCILTHFLHVGSHPSPLSWVWCSYMAPAEGLGGGSICNWKGLWLALYTRPLPCQLIGTMSGQNTAALPLIDGCRYQGCFFLTIERYSQLGTSASVATSCIHSNLL